MTSLDIWKLFEPDSYFKSFLDKGERPDGRDFNTARPIIIKVGTVTTAEGSATVRVGNTTVMCGIKAEIATPTLRRPEEGFIVPNVELYSCSSPRFKAGPPGEKAIATSQFLKNVINSSKMINAQDLCIVPNKFAWCLYCDVVCLNYDGNIEDAALISFMAAIQNVTLPDITYDRESDRITVALERTIKLKLKAKPVSCTFTIYNENIQLMDPTVEDEDQGSGEVTMVLLEDGSVCTTQKPGGRLITPDTLKHFVTLSKARVRAVNQYISDALQEQMDTS